MKRRSFLAATGAAGAASIGVAHARKPAILPRYLNREFIRVGIVGLSPYSAADDYIRLINDPAIPPRTNMLVTAVNARKDGFREAFRGSDTFVSEQAGLLAERNDTARFRTEYGVEHIVDSPHEMTELVDAVFVMEPQDAAGDARMFLDAGIPVCVTAPFARTMRDTRELVRCAEEQDVMLMGGSYVPWHPALRAARSRIDRNTVQHYYTESTADTLLTGLFHGLGTALALAGGDVLECSTHGMQDTLTGDPTAPSPVTVYPVHVPTAIERDRIVGSVSTWYSRPHEAWAKVFTDDGTVEEHITPGDNDSPDTAGNRLLAFIRAADRAFETGVAPETSEYLLEYMRVMLMAHRSGTLGGRSVGRYEIEEHALPRVVTEPA
jgi:predicted dehydrogenase